MHIYKSDVQNLDGLGFDSSKETVKEYGVEKGFQSFLGRSSVDNQVHSYRREGLGRHCRKQSNEVATGHITIFLTKGEQLEVQITEYWK